MRWRRARRWVGIATGNVNLGQECLRALGGFRGTPID